MKQQTDSKNVYDEEIDLFELVVGIWKQRVTVISIALLVTLMAITYAFLVPSIYRSSVLLKPVTNNELDEINRTKLISLTPEQALSKVGSKLNSYDLLFSFFKENIEQFDGYVNDDATLEENFANFFNKHTKVKWPEAPKNNTPNVDNFIEFDIEYSQDINGPSIANGIVDYAVDAYKGDVIQNIEITKKNSLNNLNKELISYRAGYKANLDSEIAKIQEEDNIKRLALQKELSAIRNSLKNIRENRIQQLDEAIKIAEKLGIKKPTTPSGFNDSDINFSGNVFRTEVNSNQIPLYFMGVDALEAEKIALESRESDDFTSKKIVDIQRELKLLETNPKIEWLRARQKPDLFLDGFADLEKEISYLENTQIDLDNLELVKVDHYAFHMDSSRKPSRKLIILIGIVLGLLLGVFAALIKQAVINYKKSKVL